MPLNSENYTTQQKIVIPEARNYKATPGNGVEANVDGLRICGGNQKLMRNLNVDITDLHNKAEEFACKGGTPVFFSADNIPLYGQNGRPPIGARLRFTHKQLISPKCRSPEFLPQASVPG